MKSYISSPTNALSGTLKIPSDKSITHRAIMLAALANGISTLKNISTGRDCLATLDALHALGIQYHFESEQLIVHGNGLHGLQEAKHAIDFANAGTGIRLMTGILCGQDFNSTLIGDASLSKRPMNRIIKPLEMMGAKISAYENNFLPLKITGNNTLKSISYEMLIASAQVKSAILLASFFADGVTKIIENQSSRDHTENLLKFLGCELTHKNNEIIFPGRQKINAFNLEIPGDISSAAFFIVAAIITKNSRLILQNIGVNPTRLGLINILKKMGANIILQNERVIANETIADIVVTSSDLNAIEITEELIPSCIDEIPILAIAAACAKGITTIKGAQELRYKETDRINAMVLGLKNLGIKTEEYSDGFSIEGGTIIGGTVESFADHRIAMAYTIAGLCAQEEVIIKDVENINTSFPEFFDLAQKVGMKLKR